MRRVARLLAVVLSLGLACAACGLEVDPAPRALPVLEPERAAAPTLRPGARSTTLYLVRDAALAPVTRRTASTATPRSALQLLLRGAAPEESAQGLGSALGPDAVVLEDVRVEGEIVLVPLAAIPAGAGRSDEVLAYAQIVATLTALPGVAAVRFVRDGRPLVVPRADGALAEGPFTRSDYAALL